jgi:hypothetical protein
VLIEFLAFFVAYFTLLHNAPFTRAYFTVTAGGAYQCFLSANQLLSKPSEGEDAEVMAERAEGLSLDLCRKTDFLREIGVLVRGSLLLQVEIDQGANCCSRVRGSPIEGKGGREKRVDVATRCATKKPILLYSC